MNENEKMFQIGIWSAAIVAMLVVMLQVCYRTQDKSRQRVHNDIVRTQQEIAEQQTKFSALVRPEILRNLVDSVLPKTEPISFRKAVTIENLPDKKSTD